MDQTTATVVVGIAGLAATAVTSIWQVWFAGMRERGSRRFEQDRADREELRAVVDDAATTLWQLLRSHEQTWEGFASHRIYPANLRFESRSLADKAHLDSGRLALRLGRAHPVFVSHANTLDALEDLDADLARSIVGIDRVDPDQGRLVGFLRVAGPHLLRRRNLADGPSRVLSERRAELLAAHATFLEASRVLVGKSDDERHP